jgi:hypothetical protein
VGKVTVGIGNAVGVGSAVGRVVGKGGGVGRPVGRPVGSVGNGSAVGNVGRVMVGNGMGSGNAEGNAGGAGKPLGNVGSGKPLGSGGSVRGKPASGKPGRFRSWADWPVCSSPVPPHAIATRGRLTPARNAMSFIMFS